MKHALIAAALALLLAACTTTTVNEHREVATNLKLGSAEKIVVLGRRHAGHYETEPDFIRCIGDKLNGVPNVEVLDEKAFIDSVYPWFEPRTAPLKLARLEYLLREPLLASRIQQLGVRYMIWVDGNTETTESSGSVSCAVAPGAGGCFGFATWDKVSNYEAVIWDVDDFSDKGRVRVDAEGSSYLLAIGAPIPFIARVQGEACEGIGNQLRTFFTPDGAAQAPTP
ncbi:MAG: hypothetical protein WDA10_06545 [Porticoccaceae bacterium]|jgi:hypothetical protein|nr:hypothetical protein [Porticoccaceae bacterium]HLS99005.1 hypothetical protein [Porticoccaceae bacterium]